MDVDEPRALHAKSDGDEAPITQLVPDLVRGTPKMDWVEFASWSFAMAHTLCGNSDHISGSHVPRS